MSSRSRAITELFETVSLGAPERAVGFVLWRVVHRYTREVDRALIPIELTHLQFTTLAIAAWLSRSADTVTQSELAKFADIHPMQVSQILKTLESKSMIARARSTSDIRAKHVEVTAAGVRTLRRAMPVVIDVQRRLFGKEAAPGGYFLTALLRVDSEQMD